MKTDKTIGFYMKVRKCGNGINRYEGKINCNKKLDLMVIQSMVNYIIPIL